MAITWQNVSGPNLNGATKLMNDAATNASSSLSNLANSITEQRSLVEGRQDRDRKKEFDKQIAQASLGANSRSEFKTNALMLGQANGYSAEEVASATQGGEDLYNSITSLSAREQAKVDRDVSAINTDNVNALANLENTYNANNKAKKESYGGTLYGEGDLGIGAVTSGILSSIEDPEYATEVNKTIQKIVLDNSNIDNSSVESGGRRKVSDKAISKAIATLGTPVEDNGLLTAGFFDKSRWLDGVDAESFEKNIIDLATKIDNDNADYNDYNAEKLREYNSDVNNTKEDTAKKLMDFQDNQDAEAIEKAIAASKRFQY